MKFFTKEIKIAITAIIAVIIIYVGVILLKGLKIFNTDAEYIVSMEDVTGISVSSDVLVNGLKIGYVKSIRYNKQNQGIYLSLSVNPSFEIPTGTTVFVSKELLGSSKLNLELGRPSNPPIAPGDTLYGTESNDLMAAVGDMMPQIEEMLPKIDSILTSLNALASDPALAATLHNLEYTTNSLRTTTDEVNRLMRSDVPQLLASANHVMNNAETLTATLNDIDIAGIAQTANQTLTNANQAVGRLNTAMNSRDNTLGLLLNDKTLALRLDTTVINASLLLEDLRLHPKRYVHFSIFGKKDK